MFKLRSARVSDPAETINRRSPSPPARLSVVICDLARRSATMPYNGETLSRAGQRTQVQPGIVIVLSGTGRPAVGGFPLSRSEASPFVAMLH